MADEPQNRKDSIERGAHAPSRAVFRALAEHMGDSPKTEDLSTGLSLTPTGEGAGRNTRGRVCSPTPAKSSEPNSATDNVQSVANAVLYEGYLLYPYRASALKNKQRWNF